MSAQYAIKRLPKTFQSSQKDIPKYYLSTCQDRITTKQPSTKDWITILKTLKLPIETFDKSRVLLATLEQHEQIVVKLGDDESIKQEYEFGKRLYKIKGFVKFICYFEQLCPPGTQKNFQGFCPAIFLTKNSQETTYPKERRGSKGEPAVPPNFECNDNYLDYPNPKKNHLCHGPGSQMKVIVMPHFELGNIGSYTWTHENIHILRTCMKHAFLSYTNAFFHGYLHGDFHPGNVLLKKTKQAKIDYVFREKENEEVLDIETNGMRTWIMDFENTKIANRDNLTHIMDYYYEIQRFFNTIKDIRFIRTMKEDSLIPVRKILNTYSHKEIFPTVDFIKNMLFSIDRVELV
jgi:hypothetical protein